MIYFKVLNKTKIFHVSYKWMVTGNMKHFLFSNKYNKTKHQMLYMISRPPYKYKELNTRRTQVCSFVEVARNHQIQKKRRVQAPYYYLHSLNSWILVVYLWIPSSTVYPTWALSATTLNQQLTTDKEFQFSTSSYNLSPEYETNKYLRTSPLDCPTRMLTTKCTIPYSFFTRLLLNT